MGEVDSFARVFEEGYFGSKAFQTSHLIGHHVSYALFAFKDNAHPDNSEHKKNMLQELENASDLPDYGVFNLALLKQIIKVFQDADWNDNTRLHEAVRRVRELREQT